MRDTHWRSSLTGPGQPAPGVRGKTPDAPDPRPGGTSVPRLRRRPAAGPQAPQQYSRATGRSTPRGIRSPVPPATGSRRVGGAPRDVEQVRDHPGHGEPEGWWRASRGVNDPVPLATGKPSAEALSNPHAPAGAPGHGRRPGRVLSSLRRQCSRGPGRAGDGR